MLNTRQGIRQLAALKARGKQRLPAAQARGAIVSARGKGLPTGTAAAASGIASPLREIVGSRTYHAEKTIDSTDGFFQLVYEPLKSVRMLDAGGRVVEFNFDDPE